MYEPQGEGCYGCKALARRVEDAEERLIELKEHCAALESREVCTVAHEDVETCGYCQRDALSKDAERYRWLVNCNDAGVWAFLAGMDDDQIDEAIDKWMAASETESGTHKQE